MRFGLPYKGSKNGIAKKIIDFLPQGETFVDLFSGGGSITHAAMLSGKYQNFIMNDIRPGLTQFFVDAANGDIKDSLRWVSREDFNRDKTSDWYVALLWSFGNNAKDYMYSKILEPYKMATHYSIVFDYHSKLDQMFGSHPTYTNDSLSDRYRCFKKWVNENFSYIANIVYGDDDVKRIRSSQSLQSLERLQSLEKDYKDVVIPCGSVVYCDIPYKGTSNPYQSDGFDYDAFYEWARQDHPFQLFISEYTMPDDFKCVCEIVKPVLSSAKGCDSHAVEKIFIPARTN